MPCFDEADTVAALVDRVLASPWTAEVVVVDDGSTDGTAKVLADLVAELDDPIACTVITHERNRGKGAALRSAFAVVTGEYVVVQDADLEYDPREYDVLLEPLERGVADVVFGSRFLSGRPHRVLYFWHSLGNRTLTLLSNMFTDLNLTDMESCYKCFRREVLDGAHAARGSLRHRAGAHRQGRRRRLADLRGRHLLQRAHLRRGQEDRLARRDVGGGVHRPLLPRPPPPRRRLGRADTRAD